MAFDPFGHALRGRARVQYRIVLSYYSTPEAARRTFQELRKRQFRDAVLITAVQNAGSPAVESKGSRTNFERYLPLLSDTILQGESIVAVRIHVREVAMVLEVARLTEPPTVFVLPDETDDSVPGAGFADEPQGLPGHGAELAVTHHPTTAKPPPPLDKLKEYEDALEASVGSIIEAVQREQPLTNAAEWLYDNLHLIRSHIAEIRRHLPKQPEKLLAAIDDSEPDFRVLKMAMHLVRTSDCNLTGPAISEFLDSYQAVELLNIAELWVFPLMIRLALIEALSRLARKVACELHRRDLAYFWADRMARAGRSGPQILERMLDRFDAAPETANRQFIARITEHLNEEDATLAEVRQRIERRLGQPLAELIRQEHSEQARDRVSIANAVNTLRLLSHLDYTEILESVSRVEAVLARDPAGVYSRSDFATRDRCRRAVEHIARYGSLTELQVAHQALELASAALEQGSVQRHVGYYLLDAGRRNLESNARYRAPFGDRARRVIENHGTAAYIGSIVTFTLALVVSVLSWTLMADQGTDSWKMLAFLTLLAIYPASELAVQFTNYLVVKLLPPRVLPKMSFKTGIPEDCATLVVVPMMLLTPESIRSEVEKLEIRYLANKNERLWFALISDFTDAPQQSMPEDDSLLDVVAGLMEDLSARHEGKRFLLFHRTRRWCECEQSWIGWERKRGKLEELNKYLNGEPSPYEHFLLVGDLPAHRFRFVITLDADTQLPAGTARQMIETAAHLLNRVEISPERRVRKRGYTIIQPRVSITLPATTATRFTRLFTSTSGTDPYCQAVSDAYQDLFGEAIYHGKAIYDVEAFHKILSDRFPEQRLLSHDLIEGAHVGVGLASDIELFENFPYTYQSHAKRQHRWIRGDWQISPWVFPRVPRSGGGTERNPLSVINRWKVLDNLRRSLVDASCVLLLIVSWMWKVAPEPWSLFVAFCLVFPTANHILKRLLLRVSRLHHGSEDSTDYTRFVVTLSFLPHQACVHIDAIFRSLYRMLISHRHLLEWETAELAGLAAAKHFNIVFVQTTIIAIVMSVLMTILFHQGLLWPVFPFIALWVGAPEVLRWIGRPERAPADKHLPDASRIYLRGIARDTWRFFDDTVGPQTNWLPPDNSQEALRVEIAQRTSPTNIGMWLTSLLGAYDFGYITIDQFVYRCAATLGTLEKLERYQGHFLNWYDTQTLAPLNPRYVSTVDSGNFVASLWVLEVACRELITTPLLSAASLRGLADVTNAARKAAQGSSAAGVPFTTLRRLFRGGGASITFAERIRLAGAPIRQLNEALRWSASGDDEIAYWLPRLQQHADAWVDVVDRYLRWQELLAAPPREFLAPLGPAAWEAREQAVHSSPSLADIAAGPSAPLSALFVLRENPASLGKPQLAWLEELWRGFTRSQTLAAEIIVQIEGLIEQLKRFDAPVDFGLLYDPARKLFTIGQVVGEPVNTGSHYDLLASEARLTSLIAIARGDVPIEHWLTLGRPYVSRPEGQLLLSWGGTMFEYMMPQLFTRAHENSLLAHGCELAVKRQIEYGGERGIPWGISEAAYAALDGRQIYQYKAFGVPGLGLKPGLENDLVVSPYSTMLALPVDPVAAIANLRRLEREGARAKLGFYESIDYTRSRSREGGAGVLVYAHFAHHQGMGFTALTNALHRNIIVERFHRDPRISAVESLLFEGIPKPKSMLPSPRATEEAPVRVEAQPGPADRVFADDSPMPRAQLLGNGSYLLVVTNSGGGYSHWRDLDLTRWRADGTRDHWGSICYLRDTRTGRTWSTSNLATGAKDGTFNAVFSTDRVELVRRENGIEARTEITVCSEDDVEIRRITLVNRSLRPRMLEFTSFSEICIAPHNADRSHPAFSKMFVQTEPLPHIQGLLATRRKRTPGEETFWFGECIFGDDVGAEDPGAFEYDTDRVPFIGRGNSVRNPAGLNAKLTGTAGTVLDPIFAMRRRVIVEPRDRLQLTIVRAAGDSREGVIKLLERYRSADACHRAFELAWTHTQLTFRHLGIQAETAHRFQELAGYVVFSLPALRAPAERIRRNRLPQSRLWAHGISGDLPIVVVTVPDADGIVLLREVLLAHTFWALRGLKVDLVVLNQESPSYDQPLFNQLIKLIQSHSVHTGVDKPGGVFLRNWHQIPDDELNLLLTTASASLTPPRSLVQHLARTGPPASDLPLFVPTAEVARIPSPELPFLELPYFNGLGGFSADGRQYSIYLGPGQQTPLPWSNVMANASFGALLSEAGPGFTWYGNSQTNRLTPWSNDPVQNPAGDALYIRDEETGEFWTPTALPIREQEAYRANHGSGYSLFEHNSHGLEQLLLTFVPVSDEAPLSIRVQRLRLRNASGRRRRFSVTAYAEWTLGGDREVTQPFIITEWDGKAGCMLARNTHRDDYGDRVAFAALSPKVLSYTGDRMGFLGRNGSLEAPSALRYARLTGATGVALDPCAALQTAVDLDAGASADIVWLIGEAANTEEARSLIERFRKTEDVERQYLATRAWWDHFLSAITVRTPVASVNFLLNHWLLYQTLSCRIWGRSAFYQSGGAFGFRDQLQDVLALLWSDPQHARSHILLAASRQFPEGDVQHWWHPPGGGGVRTLCSDDMLWLPYAVCQYVRVTGDSAILDERVPFLEGPALKEGEHDLYFVPGVSSREATLFEHCRLAIDHGLRTGPHGLPLMGNGDWNDGMNLVGAKGRGESVWLAWFLLDVLREFSRLCERSEESALREAYASAAARLRDSVEAAAWDGEWYLRAFFDDGTPLGSHLNNEAKIDSIAQSWNVISGAGDPVRGAQAMDSVEKMLIKDVERLVLLFDPPLDHATPHAGYIQGYPPGVRENGGQYTHAALWTAMAYSRMGDAGRSFRVLQHLNPVELARIPEQVAKFQGEPYVVPADVYSLEGRAGRCGWNWYTGSAGWMYRIWVEEILGLRVEGGNLTLRPAVPPQWSEYEITYRFGNTHYRILVTANAPERSLKLDGVTVSEPIRLADDSAKHTIHLSLRPREILTPASTPVLSAS